LYKDHDLIWNVGESESELCALCYVDYVGASLFLPKVGSHEIVT
jgi:hypothetical protein